VFIPNEASPDPGDAEYTAERIHPLTMAFLQGEVLELVKF